MFLQYLCMGWMSCHFSQVMYSSLELPNWTWTCTDAGNCTIGTSMCNSIDTGTCTGRLALTLALRSTVVANGTSTCTGVSTGTGSGAGTGTGGRWRWQWRWIILRSTSSPIPYPCYTILRGLRFVEVRLRLLLRSTSSPFPIPGTLLEPLRFLETRSL